MITYFVDGFKMIADLSRQTPRIGVWGGALNIPQVIGGLFFLPRAEAILVIVACAGSVLVAAQMHKRRPFTRLTSIVHVVWLPLVPYLVYALYRDGIQTLFSYWLVYVSVVIAISLVFDIRNLVIYAKDRNSKFEGVAS